MGMGQEVRSSVSAPVACGTVGGSLDFGALDRHRPLFRLFSRGNQQFGPIVGRPFNCTCVATSPTRITTLCSAPACWISTSTGWNSFPSRSTSARIDSTLLLSLAARADDVTTTQPRKKASEYGIHGFAALLSPFAPAKVAEKPRHFRGAKGDNSYLSFAQSLESGRT